MIKIFKTKACNSINDISLFLSSQVSYENTHCQWFCIAHLCCLSFHLLFLHLQSKWRLFCDYEGKMLFPFKKSKHFFCFWKTQSTEIWFELSSRDPSWLLEFLLYWTANIQVKKISVEFHSAELILSNHRLKY